MGDESCSSDPKNDIVMDVEPSRPSSPPLEQHGLDLSHIQPSFLPFGFTAPPTAVAVNVNHHPHSQSSDVSPWRDGVLMSHSSPESPVHFNEQTAMGNFTANTANGMRAPPPSVTFSATFTHQLDEAEAQPNGDLVSDPQGRNLLPSCFFKCN